MRAFQTCGSGLEFKEFQSGLYCSIEDEASGPNKANNKRARENPPAMADCCLAVREASHLKQQEAGGGNWS
jgi:hypothetical protein